MKLLLLAMLLLPLIFFLVSSRPDTLGKVTASDASEIETLETSYFQKTGRYLQVLPDNKLPHYEQGTVLEKLDQELPAGYRVDVYETYNGENGYQISWDDSQNWYSKGTGPEAAIRTYTDRKFIKTATST